MKITVRVTVNIDPDAWAHEYGVDRDRVREDVKAYIENAVQESEGVRSCGPALVPTHHSDRLGPVTIPED